MSHFQSSSARVSESLEVCGVSSIEAQWPGKDCPDGSPPRVPRFFKWNCSIWYGVQASIGGTCVLVMLRAMWPSVNTIRESMDSFRGMGTLSISSTHHFERSQFTPRFFRNKYSGLYMLLPVLAPIAAINMVSRA